MNKYKNHLQTASSKVAIHLLRNKKWGKTAVFFHKSAFFLK